MTPARHAIVLAYHANHVDKKNPSAGTLDAFAADALASYGKTIRQRLPNATEPEVAFVAMLAAVNGGGTPALKARRACEYYTNVRDYLSGETVPLVAAVGALAAAAARDTSELGGQVVTDITVVAQVKMAEKPAKRRAKRAKPIDELPPPSDVEA